MNGEFNEENLPTPLELVLKIGTQVMLLNNDGCGRWVNGDIGRVVAIDEKEGEPDQIVVELADGRVVEVTPYKWEIFEYYYDDQAKKISTKVLGTFTQVPLKLAWAITIHKSQGLTFDKRYMSNEAKS